MTENISEEDILRRAENGLRRAAEARNMKWGAGTKVKRLKYIDIALDHFIGRISDPEGQTSPITRSWYKYGCVQSANTSKTPFTPDAAPGRLQSVDDGIGSESNDNSEGIEMEFQQPEMIVGEDDDTSVSLEKHEIADVGESEFFEFFLDGWYSPVLDEQRWVRMSNLEFLREYYTHKAPPEIKDIYLANVELRQVLEEAYEKVKKIEQNRTAFLIDEGEIETEWEPVELAERLGRAAVNFRLSLYASPYVPDSVIEDILSFTDLLEDIMDGMTVLEKTDIRPKHYVSLQNLIEFLDDPIWEWIARYISYATVVGPEAESWREATRKELISFEATCGEQITDLRKQYDNDGLLAPASTYRTGPSDTAEQFMTMIDMEAIRKRAKRRAEEVDIDE